MSGKYLELLRKVTKTWVKADASHFTGSLSELEIISASEEGVKAEFNVTESMTNPGGHLHGGCTATIIDIVSSLGLLCSSNPRPGVSMNLNVNYASSAKIGDRIVIESKNLKVGRSTAYLDIVMRDKESGKVIAFGTHVKHLS